MSDGAMTLPSAYELVWLDDGRVARQWVRCCTCDGKFWRPQVLSQCFDDVCAASGSPPLSFLWDIFPLGHFFSDAFQGTSMSLRKSSVCWSNSR
jgi:hypothetical protein